MWPGQGANGPLRASGRDVRAASDKLDLCGAVWCRGCEPSPRRDTLFSKPTEVAASGDPCASTRRVPDAPSPHNQKQGNQQVLAAWWRHRQNPPRSAVALTGVNATSVRPPALHIQDGSDIRNEQGSEASGEVQGNTNGARQRRH